jgi:hypothetical protein
MCIFKFAGKIKKNMVNAESSNDIFLKNVEAK